MITRLLLCISISRRGEWKRDEKGGEQEWERREGKWEMEGEGKRRKNKKGRGGKGERGEKRNGRGMRWEIGRGSKEKMRRGGGEGLL